MWNETKNISIQLKSKCASQKTDKRTHLRYLGRLWVCAGPGNVDGVGDDEGACPWDEVGTEEALGRKGAPWQGAGRQEVAEEGEEEEGVRG